MFVGYSLRLIENEGISPEDYQEKVVSQVKVDIDDALSYIDAEITKFGMSGCSFYIYILPFTDADTDKKTIFDKLLQSGGDSL